MFGSAPDPKSKSLTESRSTTDDAGGHKRKTRVEQLKETKRDLGKLQRDLDRDRAALEREEVKLVADIKRHAKAVRF